MTFELGKKLWRLYDSGQKNFYNDLNLIQLAKVISAIPGDNIGSWFICETGEPDWTPLAEKMQSFGDMGIIEQTNTFVGLITNSEESAQPGSNFDALIGDLQKADKRQMGRIKTSIPVFIDVNARILTCNTSDISILGIKLDQDFPIQYQGKYYPLILKTSPVINLRCMPLLGPEDEKKQKWNRMQIHPDFSLSQLADFLSKLEK